MAKRIALPSKLDTAAAAALRDDLIAAEGTDIVFDAGQVEQIGALCLETILSAAALWKAEGLTVTLDSPSAQLTEDLSRFGLTPATLLEHAA
ncbi:MAG: STAS domain-containing protein [Silicimonas sp.]|jgi:chemotaxis protein CheX|nr:STAS domain-containing protein [Silicimonas sp.]